MSEPKNKIILATAKLVKVIREADQNTVTEAKEQLQEFADNWLIAGDQTDLPGAGSCCLADTDTTEAIKGVLEIWWENLK